MRNWCLTLVNSAQPYNRIPWGEANINGISIHQGETILVPACENVLYIFGNATFLTATM